MAQARELFLTIENATPAWLSRFSVGAKYSGLREPGPYSFDVIAYVIEKGFRSDTATRRVEGVVQYQPPQWQTPEHIDAAFAGEPVALTVSALSYAASIVYSTGAHLVDDIVQLDTATGAIVFTPNGFAGTEHAFTVLATPVAQEGIDASRLLDATDSRTFVCWELAREDLRPATAFVSDLVQSVRDGGVEITEMVAPAVYAADVSTMAQRCLTRTVVYCVDQGASQNANCDVVLIGADGSEESVLTHAYDVSVDRDTARVATAGVEEAQSLGSAPRLAVYALTIDRIESTLTVARLDDSGSSSDATFRYGPAMVDWTRVRLDTGRGVVASASAFVTAGTDVRIRDALSLLRLPDPWPITDVFGCARVGVESSITLADTIDRNYDIRAFAVPGMVVDTDGSTVSGTPLEVNAYEVRMRATESDGLYASMDMKFDTLALDWSGDLGNVEGNVYTNGDYQLTLIPREPDLAPGISRVTEASVDVTPSTDGVSASVRYGGASGATVTVVGEPQAVGTVIVSVSATVLVRDANTLTTQSQLSISVRNSIPVWLVGAVKAQNHVFVGGTFARYARAVSTGALSYYDPANVPEGLALTRTETRGGVLIKARVEDVGQITSDFVRAITDSDSIDSALTITLDVYDPGIVYGADATNPGGPSVADLLPQIEARGPYDVLASQVPASAGMRFSPTIDSVSLIGGGCLVYLVLFDDLAGGEDAGICVRIPGIADIVHTYDDVSSGVSIGITEPTAGPDAGRATAGATVLGSAVLPVARAETGRFLMLASWDSEKIISVRNAEGEGGQVSSDRIWDRSAWTVAASSQHSSHPASNVLDGDPSTTWHNDSSSPATPETLTISFEQGYDLTGIEYVPRTDRSLNGTFGDYQVHVSYHGSYFEEFPIAQGSFAYTHDPKRANFRANGCMAVRLTCLSSYAELGGSLASASEIWLFGHVSSHAVEVPDVAASDIVWDVTDVDRVAVGGHCLATFEGDARVVDFVGESLFPP